MRGHWYLYRSYHHANISIIEGPNKQLLRFSRTLTHHAIDVVSTAVNINTLYLESRKQLVKERLMLPIQLRQNFARERLVGQASDGADAVQYVQL